MLRAARLEDCQAIATIYNHYVSSTIITFEEVPVSAEEITRRVNGIQAASLPWLVAEEGGKVVGYSYAHPWAERRGYRTSVECSVYVAQDATGRGLGKQLYAELFRLLRERTDLHVVIGGIALPNEASIALHKSFGFEKVAHFKEVGTKFGKMIDVAYFQLWLKPEPIRR